MKTDFSKNNPILNRPVFIVGNAHSGTTLLRNIIGKYPGIFMVEDETHFFSILPLIKNVFNYQKEIKKLSEFVDFVINIIQPLGYQIIYNYDYKYKKFRLSDKFRKLADEIMEAGTVSESYSHVENFELILNFLTIRNKKERWLEKTPFHVFHIEKIINTISNPQFIEIVRDPRNIIASRKLRDKADQEKYIIFKDILEWRKSIKSGLKIKRKFPTHILTIKYEDLVDTTEATLISVCKQLGIKYQKNMDDAPHVNPIPGVKYKKKPNELINTDKWQNTLSNKEVGLIEFWLKKYMRIYKYEIVSDITEQFLANNLLLSNLIEIFKWLKGKIKTGGLLKLWYYFKKVK